LVDLIYVGADKDSVKLDNGILADIAPTMLALLGIDKPAEMSGHSLVSPK
jgi:2,3-bisphosphoglycerate-independent phosphoglycerate mutase